MAKRHVRVCVANYGRTGVVVLVRWPWQRFYQSGLRVATLNLEADDAEMQVAEAIAKARSLGSSIDRLERLAVRS